MVFIIYRFWSTFLAGMAIVTPVGAGAATLLHTPAKADILWVRYAGQFELKLHLPGGHGLARLLIDAGVAQDDAAAAAKVAAGRMGDGRNGCLAIVSVERVAGSDLKVVRVVLTSDEQRTIIERRGTELIIASESAMAMQPRLV